MGGGSWTDIRDPEALKQRYRLYDSRILRRWMEVITGDRREAIAAVLRERGESV